jgi:hypothetical protein
MSVDRRCTGGKPGRPKGTGRYNVDHRNRRAGHLRRMTAGESFRCWDAECGQTILPGQAWAEGHFPAGHPRITEVSAPLHRQCNQRQAVRTVGPIRSGQVAPPQPKPVTAVTTPAGGCPVRDCRGHENHRLTLRPTALVRGDGCQVSELALPHAVTAAAWRTLHGISQ